MTWVKLATNIGSMEIASVSRYCPILMPNGIAMSRERCVLTERHVVARSVTAVPRARGTPKSIRAMLAESPRLRPSIAISNKHGPNDYQNIIAL
jgi:hypothetical protein